jgi:hypothetical protein
LVRTSTPCRAGRRYKNPGTSRNASSVLCSHPRPIRRDGSRGGLADNAGRLRPHWRLAAGTKRRPWAAEAGKRQRDCNEHALRRWGHLRGTISGFVAGEARPKETGERHGGLPWPDLVGWHAAPLQSWGTSYGTALDSLASGRPPRRRSKGSLSGQAGPACRQVGGQASRPPRKKLWRRLLHEASRPYWLPRGSQALSGSQHRTTTRGTSTVWHSTDHA